MPKNLVIVESPTKVKNLEKFLGSDYKVMTSYGHIRDLKKHDFSIEVANHFKPVYEIPEDKKNVVAELKKAVAKAETVWLASDEDREGEAISWHLYEVLGLSPGNSKRIVFHEITKPAILRAIETPRAIDLNLVNAQQARRVLDRLVGFEVSPILWRKVKPSLSAGRVQSVTARLVVEREREIAQFRPEESYRVTGTFTATDDAGHPVTFDAELSQRFKTQDEARAFLQSLAGARFTIADVQQKPSQRHPAPPFTTSTLQQEAFRKLHFSVSQTMSIAQRLYESGLITYMRTDSVNLSTLCIAASKEQILATMGPDYHHARNFQTRTKGAQEAHEAIRPTYMDRTAITGSANEKRLYELIWKRTIASQMAEAQIERTVVDIAVQAAGQELRNLRFVATGEIIKFDGFLKVYIESNDDETDESAEARLPRLAVGQTLDMQGAEATQRFTQRPLRYTEASLVKKMEELGIGRPSTYSSTISTIIARQYVEKSDRPAEKRDIQHLRLGKTGKITHSTTSETISNDRGKLVPTDIGIVVNDFLEAHFPDLMSFNFTATVESEFDQIAEGKAEWSKCIGDFYKVFHPLVERSLEERQDRKAGERILGKDPKTGYTVSVKISRFGPVAQIGAADEVGKPRFASLGKGQSLATITLDEAIHLFDLPKDLGEYEGKTVTIGTGRLGPYVRHDGKFASIPKDLDPLDLTIDQAIGIINARRAEDQKKVLRTFPEDAALQILNGRYGPYLTRDGKNYKIPRGKKPEELSYADCLQLIEAAEAEPAKESAPRRGRFSRRSK